MTESALAPWSYTGEGTLAQYRGVTLLVGPGDELVTGQLLAAARAAAGDGTDDRLRQLASRLIEANGSAPAICAVGEVPGGVAALVHGAARVTVRTDRGALSLAGCPHVPVIDGFLAGQVSLVEAALGPDEDPEPMVELTEAAEPMAELTEAAEPPGAEPPGAASLDAAGELPVEEVAVAPAPAGPAPVRSVDEVVAAVRDVMAAVEQALAGLAVEPSTGRAVPPAVVTAEATAAVADGQPTAVAVEEAVATVTEELLATPEAGEPSAVAVVAEVDDHGEVRATGVTAISGVRCRKGHFNDPNLPYCVVCGIGLTQAGRVFAESERPVLGVLLLDDGRLLPLDRDHVFGSSPDQAEQVRTGEATAVALTDPLVSDVHALISLRGWEVSVTDAGSRHGTYLRNPGSTDWEPLHGGSQRVLQPGALVAIGARQLRFETYRK